MFCELKSFIDERIKPDTRKKNSQLFFKVLKASKNEISCCPLKVEYRLII